MSSPLGSSEAVALQSCITHFPYQVGHYPSKYLPSTHPSYESTLATSLDNPKRSLVAHSNQKANTSPGTPWNPMELKFRGIQLDSLEFDRFPCNSMEFHEIAEASLTSNAIHCNPMHPYGVPWKPWNSRTPWIPWSLRVSTFIYLVPKSVIFMEYHVSIA